MNGLQIPRWIIPVAGFAAAVWAIAMWWMVASLPAAGASEADLDLVVARAEIDRLEVNVDELSQQISALQQQRSEFTLRLDALEDGSAMVGVAAPAPAAQPAAPMAGPEPAAADSTDNNGDALPEPEASPEAPDEPEDEVTTPASTSPVAPPSPTPAPEPELFVEPVAPPASVEYYTDGRDLYSCRDFDSWEEAQQVYQANLPGDPNKIDIDRNGIACEALRD